MNGGKTDLFFLFLPPIVISPLPSCWTDTDLQSRQFLLPFPRKCIDRWDSIRGWMLFQNKNTYVCFLFIGSKEASFPLSLFSFFLKRYLNAMATAFNPSLVWHNQIWKRLAVCCNQIQAGQSCKEMTSHAPWNNEWIDHIGLLPSFPPYHLKCWGISIWSLVNKIEVNNFQRLPENTECCRDGEELVVIMPKNKKSPRCTCASLCH